MDNEPSATFTSGDVASLQQFAPGTVGTLTGTLKDANLQSGGDIVYTAVNAVFRTVTMTAPHAQFASATANWDMYSSDGVTNPISYTSYIGSGPMG